MRSFAKALPCLLFCVACVTLAPATASPLDRPLHPAAGKHAATGKAAVVAHRRAKGHHAAPKLAQAAPHDTSNRFLMTQNGRQMTADDFEAWMKARGIRVARGAPEAAKGTN